MPATLVGDLSGKEAIWRYMTLDRLVNLFDDKALFMTCLSAYSKSDPYEGYPPPIVLKLLQEESPDFMFFSHETSKSSDINNFKLFFERLFHSRVVSCWYQDNEESEAMWKLYGDTGKGIAIRTTVGKLSTALGNEFGGKIARVKYVNYSKPADEGAVAILRAKMEGVLLDPIFKRLSYAHEREVRAYMQIEKAKINDVETYKSHMAPINYSLMIDEIVVSPFCSESYVKAVKAVANLFGFNGQVRQSTLISDLNPLYSQLNK